MPRILFISVIRSDFSKLLSLALLLREKEYDIEFYFEQRSHNLQQSIEEAVANGFNYYGEVKAKVNAAPTSSRSGKMTVWWKKLPVFLKRFYNEKKACKSIFRNFREVLTSKKIDLVILPVNSFGYNVPVYTTICRQANIKTVCVPFAIGDREALEKAIVFSPKSSPQYLLNDWLDHLFPSWRLKTNDQYYLALPAETLLAYRIAGVNMQFPLSFYGAWVNHLFLENNYMLDHAKKQQIAAGDILVTGGILDDELTAFAEGKRSHYTELCRQYDWDDKKRLICIAMPPLVKEGSSDERFLPFLVLVDKFLPRNIDVSSCNVLVSLHPRIDKQHIHDTTWPAYLRWTGQPVETVIPLSDLFITTFSSTLRTAIALKIPVINYDILTFRYDLFKDLPGLFNTDSETGYSEILSAFVQNEDLFEKKYKISDHENSLSSTLDGKSKERLLNAIHKIIGQ